ncbi:MAG: S1C family serine protease, partial [Actinomycetes bacterium]
ESSAVINAVQSAMPAVVKIQSTTGGAVSGQATGTGFIYDSNGWILTNRHVVADAQQITVILADSRELEGHVYGIDTLTDLAIVKVDAAGLPTVKIGSSADLEQGQLAIAIGNPLGEFENTVTTGVISGLGRQIVAGGQASSSSEQLNNLIQTDAAINPGNSGGALANADGEVVGISTAIATSGDAEANAGVGFAIPIDEALEVAQALVNRKPVRVPYLGVEADPDLTPADVDRYRLANRAGALVSRVAPRGPAADAGLRRGDLVVRFGNQPVGARDQLTVAIRRSEIGVPVPVTVLRRGRQLVLQATPIDQSER